MNASLLTIIAVCLALLFGGCAQWTPADAEPGQHAQAANVAARKTGESISGALASNAKAGDALSKIRADLKELEGFTK